jgi:hypothetical protein
VLRFLAGFAVASALWGGFLFAYSRGYIDISLEPEAPPEATLVASEPEAADKATQKSPRKRRAPWQAKKARSGKTLTGDSTSGDDLGAGETRELDVGAAGGEAQLKGSEIERGFDAAFPQIRRCFVLAASDDPVRGKLTFGLRINGGGNVTKVNLSGPSALTQGEAGGCLRRAASGIRFRAYNGPDMVVHYPVTLD